MLICILLVILVIFFGALYSKKDRENQHKFIGSYGIVVLENGNEGIVKIISNQSSDYINYTAEDVLPYNTRVLIIAHNKYTNSFLVGRDNEEI